MPVLALVSAIALRIARWISFGVRAPGESNGRPIHCTRTLSSLSSATRPNSFLCRPRMWRTSVRRAHPVLRGEAEHGEPADVAPHGDADEAGEVLLALGVPGGARLAAPCGPAPVAVHDAGDVQRPLLDCPHRRHATSRTGDPVREWTAWGPRSSTSWWSAERPRTGTTSAPSEWGVVVDRLGEVAAAAGARWLTFRPYGPHPAELRRRAQARGGGRPLHGHRRPGGRRPRGVRRGRVRGAGRRARRRAGDRRARCTPRPTSSRTSSSSSGRTIGCRRRWCGSSPTASWCSSIAISPTELSGADLQDRHRRRSTAAAAGSAGSTRTHERQPPLPRHGVVLRTYKLGEADRIVVLLTAENGKVRAVAKGVRKTMSRFGARLEPMSHVRLLLYRGQASSTSSARRSRSSRCRRCSPASTGRRRGWPCSRRPTSSPSSASPTSSCTAWWSVRCGRSPSGRRRSSCRRSTGSCSPPRACAPSSTRACAAARTARQRRWWPSTSTRAARCAATAAPASPCRAGALALLRAILGGRLNDALATPESPATHEVAALATKALEHHLERRLRAVAMFER